MIKFEINSKMNFSEIVDLAAEARSTVSSQFIVTYNNEEIPKFILTDIYNIKDIQEFLEGERTMELLFPLHTPQPPNAQSPEFDAALMLLQSVVAIIEAAKTASEWRKE